MYRYIRKKVLWYTYLMEHCFILLYILYAIWIPCHYSVSPTIFFLIRYRTPLSYDTSPAWPSTILSGPSASQVWYMEQKDIMLSLTNQFFGTLPNILSRDGILGHKFNKRLESFAPCYSQSLLLQILKKTILSSGFKNPNKTSAKQENSSLFMNSIL